MHARERIGRDGEEAAWAAYRRRGFRLLERNWRTRAGELDLILVREDLVVFCEVKTRTGVVFGGPFEAVTAAKQRKIRGLAEHFLVQRRLRPAAVRFDVASVTAIRNGRPSVHLFEGAF